jgi:hypothetical protein
MLKQQAWDRNIGTVFQLRDQHPHYKQCIDGLSTNAHIASNVDANTCPNTL